MIGFSLLGFWAMATAGSRLHQQRALREIRSEQAIAHQGIKPAPFNLALSARQAAAYGNALAYLEIPRLNVSVVVEEGCDRLTLLRGVGHVRGTAFPGENGNVCIAGHRDSHFRPLKDICAGDTIRLNSRDGAFSYMVDSVFVVPPSRTDVLRGDGRPSLTLVTCYPFYYVGRAPERFIARARPLETPETVSSAGTPRPS